MSHWAFERGTFWVHDVGGDPPPICTARVLADLHELAGAGIDELAAALGEPPAPLHERLRGRRRCFALHVGGQLAAYGWATLGPERAGELERSFNLAGDEAYVWDCGTLAAWRGQRCYSALLSQLLHRLRGEGVARIWIGASRQNQPSIQGIVNAGFQHTVDITYRRYLGLTTMWFDRPPTPACPLVGAAYRVLMAPHERRLGRLALGWRFGA